MQLPRSGSLRSAALPWLVAAAPALGCASVDVGGGDLAGIVAKGPFVSDGGLDASADAAVVHDLALASDLAGTGLTTCDLHKLRINELATGLANGATDEFVELYNPCGGTVALQGGALVYRAATSSSDNYTLVQLTTQSIPAHGYFVVANTDFTDHADVKPFAQGGLAAGGGGVGLRDSAGLLVDSVGWGTATNAFVEGTVAPAPSTSQSLARSVAGVDTADNAADFTLGPPTPGAGN